MKKGEGGNSVLVIFSRPTASGAFEGTVRAGGRLTAPGATAGPCSGARSWPGAGATETETTPGEEQGKV